MKVISTFLAPACRKELGRPTRLAAFDTLVDSKSVVVGIAIGNVTNTIPESGTLGWEILTRVINHYQRHFPKTSSPVFVAEVDGVGIAAKRVRELLRYAPDQSALMLLCSDAAVYKAAFPALCVDFQSGNSDTLQ